MRSSVKQKLMTLMSAALFVAVIGLAYAKYTQIKTVNILLSSTRQEFDDKVALKSAPLKAFVNDYSYWDDMVSFIGGGSREWAVQNIDTCMPALAASGIWIFRPDGALAYSATSIDANNVRRLPLSKEALAAAFSRDKMAHFFVSVPQGVMELYGATVHPTSDSARKTPVRGYLLAGRLWSAEYVTELSQLAGGTIALEAQSKKGPVRYSRNGIISFVKALPGYDGKPVRYARAEVPSASLRDINRALNRQFYGVALLSLAILGFLYFFISKWINKPLSLIAGSIDYDDPSVIAKLQNDGTELGYIARLIMKVFQQKLQMDKEAAERRVVEQLLNRSNHDLQQRVRELTAKIEAPGTAAKKDTETLERRIDDLSSELVQEKARTDALTNEIAQLMAAEKAVKKSYAELEAKFKERTEELHAANELLHSEVAREQRKFKAGLVKALYEKKQLEKSLEMAQAELVQSTAEITTLRKNLEKELNAKNLTHDLSDQANWRYLKN